MSEFKAMFEIDSPNKVPYDERDVTIHNLSHDGVEFRMIETKDGRYDISHILKMIKVSYIDFRKSKEVDWVEISELLNRPAVIKYQYKETTSKGRTKILYCIPEELLYSFLQFSKKMSNDFLRYVIQYISKKYNRPIKQLDELKFKVLANDDMSVMISMSEHKDGWCNMGPLVMSAKKVKAEHGTIAKFLTGKSIKDDIDNVVAEYFPEHINASAQEKRDIVYQKKYGIEWMHEDLAIAFAMWISSKFRTQVYRLVKRIQSGDFTVIPDIIQNIDQVNGTKTLAQFWTYDAQSLKDNIDVKEDYERRLHELEKKAEDWRLMQEQTQLQLTNTKTSLQTFQMVVSVPEKTMKRALKVARGPNATSFHTAFDYIRENEGMMFKQIEELKYEVEDLKQKLHYSMQENIVLNERDIMTNKLIDDLDDEINEHMKIYLGAKKYAGRVITYALEFGLNIPLRAADRKVIDRDTLARIETNSINIKRKLKSIRKKQEVEAKLDFEQYKVESNSKTRPDHAFDFTPQYTGTFEKKKSDVIEPIYIYVIKHEHRSNYFKWVVHDMGDIYKDSTGYSTILSDAPFENIDRNHMIYVGSITRDVTPNDEYNIRVKDGRIGKKESLEMESYFELPTLALLQRFASVGPCRDCHFTRATGAGYVVFTTPGHPKRIEKELCYLLKHIINHKTYGNNTTKAFDNWITELTPLHTRVY